MTKQNLREREAVIALGELSGKLSIRQIRDHLKAKGFFDNPEDAIDTWELSQTRQVIGSTRKYQDKTGDFTAQLFNFTEEHDDGEKVNYYRKFSELTKEEAVQLLTDCHKRVRYWNRQLVTLYSSLRARFGKRFDKMLPFDAPELEKPKRAKRARSPISPSVN